MRRIVWLKVTLALGFLSGLLLSVRLWTGDRTYPLSPAVRWLPTVTPPTGRLWFLALLALLVAITLLRRPRVPMVIFAVSLALLCVFDQSRLQPWVYQYLFMLASLGAYSWKEADVRGREQALGLCRLIVASTLFWSGVQKMNPAFVHGTFQWMVEPIASRVPESVETVLYASGFIVPWLEAGAGIGLLAKRVRTMSVVIAVAMHAFILLMLGPLGHDWNSVVWPWNAALMVFIVLLFRRGDDVSWRAMLRQDTRTPHAIVIVLFGIMPVFSFFGLWDSYLSAALYSGNTSDATLVVSDAVTERLPAPIRAYVRGARDGTDTREIDIEGWSLGELNVPPYPEPRIYTNIARDVCRYATVPSDVLLTVRDRWVVLGAIRRPPCSCADLQGAARSAISPAPGRSPRSGRRGARGRSRRAGGWRAWSCPAPR
jgi:uncharacterized membrane protein YphA (DoxX/SURF4 family)